MKNLGIFLISIPLCIFVLAMVMGMISMFLYACREKRWTEIFCPIAVLSMIIGTVLLIISNF